MSSLNTMMGSSGIALNANRICPWHDHEPERTWRHLDSCQFRTLLHA